MDKILTKEIVKQKGWDKLTVITADILDGYTSIGNYAFSCCFGLTSITIPNSVTSIGDYAFSKCSSLTSVIIPNSVTRIRNLAFYGCFGLTSITIPNSVTKIGNCTFAACQSLTSVAIPDSVTNIDHCVFLGCGFKFEKRYDNQGRLIAYKGFETNMSCRGFKYEEGKTYEMDGEIKLCERGFHACLNSLDCLNYYWGEIGEDVVYHEVYLEDVSDENHNDSKVVARKITIGREITLSEMADIASGRK